VVFLGAGEGWIEGAGNADSERSRPVVIVTVFSVVILFLPTGVFLDGGRTAESVHQQL